MQVTDKVKIQGAKIKKDVLMFFSLIIYLALFQPVKKTPEKGKEVFDDFF